MMYLKELFSAARDADLVFAQGPVTSGLPSLIVAKILRKKIILKVVGDYAWEQARVAGKSNDLLEDFQLKFCDLKTTFLKVIQRFVTSRADKVIVPSLYLKNILANFWKIPEGKIEVIYNAFDSNNLPQNTGEKNQDFNKKEFTIISAGRFVPWKGFDLLIKIIPDLLKENHNFRLVILGSGPQEQKLKNLAAEESLEKTVSIITPENKNEFYQYLQQADIFVLNSSYEGFSHQLLEYFYFEKPVIATAIGGNKELIESGKNGILVNFGDTDALKESIIKVWQDKKMKEELAREAKKTLTNFNQEKMVKETLKVLFS